MYDANVSRLVAKHKAAGILVDTNLLLLLVVGSYQKDRIKTFKRTAGYSSRDYILLNDLIARFDVRWTTPNILTEVDNLGRQLPANEHSGFSRSFKKHVGESFEIHHESSVIVAKAEFDRLGLADVASLIQCRLCLLLSTDLPLYIRACELGYDAINFNHLRMS